MSERVTIGDCTMYLGDCREILPTLAFDVIVSDPPYGIAYRLGAGGKGKAAKRHAKMTVAGDAEPFDPAPLLAWPCLLFGANHFIASLPPGGTLHAWDKHCGVGPNDAFADVEFFWTSWRTKSRQLRHLWKGILQDSEKDARRCHPTQKPVVIMAECVRMAPAGIVCDPYMGSASTLVACARLGRPCIGVELDPGHFATACKRVEQEYRQPTFLAAPAPRPEQADMLAEAA